MLHFYEFFFTFPSPYVACFFQDAFSLYVCVWMCVPTSVLSSIFKSHFKWHIWGFHQCSVISGWPLIFRFGALRSSWLWACWLWPSPESGLFGHFTGDIQSLKLVAFSTKDSSTSLLGRSMCLAGCVLGMDLRKKPLHYVTFIMSPYIKFLFPERNAHPQLCLTPGIPETFYFIPTSE